MVTDINRLLVWTAVGVALGGCQGVVSNLPEGSSQGRNVPVSTANIPVTTEETGSNPDDNGSVDNNDNNDNNGNNNDLGDGNTEYLVGCQSQGSGGLKQDLSSQSFTASNGQKSSYHLYAANLDWNAPVGLAVILHGDGGGFYNNPQGGASGMVEILREYNMLTINVLTPDSSTKTWWINGDTNEEFLVDLVEQRVLKQYPINTDQTLIIGYSGGAEFTTIYYVPSYGQQYCGGAALLFGCGWPPSGNPEFSSEFKDRFKFHFYTGQNDQYLSNAKKGSDKYSSLGFTVTTEWPSGIGHGNIPFASVLEEQLEKGLLNH